MINAHSEQNYDIIAQDYAVGGEVKVDPFCNGWTAINNGDTLVRVCGIPLKPYPPGHPELTGAAIAIPGNQGEIYRGSHTGSILIRRRAQIRWSQSFRNFINNRHVRKRHNIYRGIQRSPSASAIDGANNGLSPSTVAADLVVLGQDIGEAGDPAILITNREIPMAGLFLNLFGGQLLFSDVTGFAGDGSTPLQMNTGQPVLYNFVSNLPNGGSHSLNYLGSSTWNDFVAQYMIFKGLNTITGPLPSTPYSIQANHTLAPSSGADRARIFAVIGDWTPTGGSNGFTGYTIESLITGLGAGEIHGYLVDWLVVSLGTGKLIAYENKSGDCYFNSVAGTNIGRTGIHAVRTPTAWVHIGAGAAAASSAPLKFTSGTLQTTPEAGAIEYNGINFFGTRTAGTRETVFTGLSGAAAPGTTLGAAFTNFYGVNITNVLGTPNNWASVNIGGTVFKIPLYT